MVFEFQTVFHYENPYGIDTISPVYSGWHTTKERAEHYINVYKYHPGFIKAETYKRTVGEPELISTITKII